MINGYEINGAEINGDASGGLVLYAQVIAHSTVLLSLVAPVVVNAVIDGQEPLSPIAVVEITSAFAIAPTAPVVVNSNEPFSLLANVEVNAHLFNTDLNSIEWTAAVYIGGVNYSTRITGRCRVERRLNASTLADFEIIPDAGVFNTDLFDGQPVEIYYSDQRGDVLIFKGRVIRFQINQVERTILLSCSDLLQEAVDKLQQAQIDTLIDHARSALIHGETDSVWDYTQQAILSAEGDFYQDRYNQMQITAWGGSPAQSHDDGKIFYETVRLDISDRHSLVNSIDIDIEFRYVAGWHRNYIINWSMGLNMAKWVLSGISELPTRQMIFDAIPADLAIGTSIFTEPATGVYRYKGAVGVFQNLSPGELAWTVDLNAIERWLQNISHSFSMSVSSQQSIDRYGVIESSNNYSLTIDDSAIDWHMMSDSARQFGVNMGYDDDGERIGNVLLPPSGDDVQAYFNNQVSSYRVPLFDKQHVPTSLRDALKCAAREARKRIVESHQINSINYEMPVNPLLELADKFSVNSLGAAMTGRVTELTHDLDFETGAAFSRIKLTAFASTNAPDIVAPSLIDTAPESVNSILPPLGTALANSLSAPVPEDFLGYTGNYVSPLTGRALTIYPQSFSVEIPEVNKAERDEIEIEQTANYAVPVNLNTLSITL